MNLTYLLLSNGCHRSAAPLSTPQPFRARFFDLGCTTYSTPKKMDSVFGAGRGPSIPLFYRMYSDRCIVFDDIYAWEAARHDPRQWYASVPAAMAEKIRFFNMPVESEMNETTSPASHPLRLLELAHPEDFVVVKVDIDGAGEFGSAAPELEIVEIIAARPELARLVDELFFEYHFWFDGLNFGWGRRKSAFSQPLFDELELRSRNLSALAARPKRMRTVDDALRLMHRLRMLGIRSHFWI